MRVPWQAYGKAYDAAVASWRQAMPQSSVSLPHMQWKKNKRRKKNQCENGAMQAAPKMAAIRHFFRHQPLVRLTQR